MGFLKNDIRSRLIIPARTEEQTTFGAEIIVLSIRAASKPGTQTPTRSPALASFTGTRKLCIDLTFFCSEMEGSSIVWEGNEERFPVLRIHLELDTGLGFEI
jgi:hypothetical protein